MNITYTTVKKLKIKDVGGLDPIVVFAENHELGKGRLTIECYGESWTAYWGAMSGQTIEQFVVSCNIDYVVKNLSKIDKFIYYENGTKEENPEYDRLCRIVETVQKAFISFRNLSGD